MRSQVLRSCRVLALFLLVVPVDSVIVLLMVAFLPAFVSRQYFQENRWRFLQRSQTNEPPGEQMENWDLARILAEIDQQFTLALAARQKLMKIPISLCFHHRHSWKTKALTQP